MSLEQKSEALNHGPRKLDNFLESVDKDPTGPGQIPLSGVSAKSSPESASILGPLICESP